MRILCLFPFLPYPPQDGARVRMWEFVRGLSRTHELDLISLVAPGEDGEGARRELQALGSSLETIPHEPRPLAEKLDVLVRGSSLYGARYRSPAFARAVERRLAVRDYDLVQCDFYYMARYRPASSSDNAVWVLHEHNLEYRLARSLAKSRTGLRSIPYRAYAEVEARRRFREELAACRRVDHVVTMTPADEEELRRRLPDVQTTVVSTGVDVDYFTPEEGQGAAAPSAVYVGKMNYRPNIEAATWFAAEVLPLVRRELPDFAFTVVGSEPAPSVRGLAAIEGVRVTGWVPDVRPYLRDSSVVVVPVRAGSGIRVKILDALASGRPVVSTGIGCEGMGCVDGEHLVIRDSAKDFADAVVRLVREPEVARRLGRAGRALVEDRYGWPGQVAKLESLYRRLVAARQA